MLWTLSPDCLAEKFVLDRAQRHVQSERHFWGKLFGPAGHFVVQHVCAILHLPETGKERHKDVVSFTSASCTQILLLSFLRS